MREIKFRYWDENNGEMVDAKQLVFWNGNVYRNERGTLHDPNRPNKPAALAGYSTMREHIMQFTGLHDKNGKEIYEGDVLGADSIFGSYEIFWSEHKAAWDAKGGTGYLPAWINSFTLGLEVIGNKWENPELLV